MYHTIIIVGNLGRDPELRMTPSGAETCQFSVAASRKYTTSTGDSVAETTWFRCHTWGKLAENCNQYLKKGARVLIEGKLTPDRDTGSPHLYQAQDGTWRASYDVKADMVRFLSAKESDEIREMHDEVPF